MPVVPSTEETIRQAAQVLRRGGLVVFPTETVYGLGADAENPEAVARVFAVKGRPADHPLIVHIGRADIAGWAADIPSVAWRLAERFWPGPLTLVLKRSARVPDVVTGGQDTVGLRVPDHPVALALLAAFGGGIAAPSANRFGRVSPTTAAHAREDLGEEVDLILDSGPCRVGIESTLLDLSGSRPRLLRPGAVTFEALAEFLGEPPAGAARDAPRVPGARASHYAPRARVILIDAGRIGSQVRALVARNLRVGVVGCAPMEDPPQGVARLPLPADAAEAARVLYAQLRTADHLGLDAVVVALPTETGLGRAIADRLRRAAGRGSAQGDC
jgi:L-threonylcarbamoyladenylate synthase